MRGGIDEAGRGPLLGPLVVAGVAVEDEDVLRALGVRDSKKLTPRRRERLATQIEEVATRTATVVLSASDIDDGRQKCTLNELEMSAFAAIGRRLNVDDYILDAADTSSERFGREFCRRLDRSPPPKVLSVHRADALHPVVAAASILAKVERDRHVTRIESRLRQTINLPLGSGYPSDPITVQFLRAYIQQEEDLPPDFRRSWRPVQELMARRNLRPLSEF